MSDVLFGGPVDLRRGAGSDEWLTPKWLTDALGPFDLDPCSPRVRPWPTATQHYTIEDDGLRQQWSGFVWCNPPYAHVSAWLAAMARHGDGIALVFARTETEAWRTAVWPHASAVMFLSKRLTFCTVDGRPARANSGAPSALIAYGTRAADRLNAHRDLGAVVEVVR